MAVQVEGSATWYHLNHCIKVQNKSESDSDSKEPDETKDDAKTDVFVCLDLDAGREQQHRHMGVQQLNVTRTELGQKTRAKMILLEPGVHQCKSDQYDAKTYTPICNTLGGQPALQ